MNIIDTSTLINNLNFNKYIDCIITGPAFFELFKMKKYENKKSNLNKLTNYLNNTSSEIRINYKTTKTFDLIRQRIYPDRNIIKYIKKVLKKESYIICDIYFEILLIVAICYISKESNIVFSSDGGNAKEPNGSICSKVCNAFIESKNNLFKKIRYSLYDAITCPSKEKLNEFSTNFFNLFINYYNSKCINKKFCVNKIAHLNCMELNNGTDKK